MEVSAEQLGTNGTPSEIIGTVWAFDLGVKTYGSKLASPDTYEQRYNAIIALASRPGDERALAIGRLVASGSTRIEDDRIVAIVAARDADPQTFFDLANQAGKVLANRSFGCTFSMHEIYTQNSLAHLNNATRTR
jgi:hypothetical protein